MVLFMNAYEFLGTNWEQKYLFLKILNFRDIGERLKIGVLNL